MQAGEVKKVLIIRTIQADLLGDLLARWKEYYPEASFDILTHASQANISYYETLFSNIYIYEANSDFAWSRLSDELKQELSGCYDVILFAHKWDSIAGFANVIDLARRLSPVQIAHSNSAGEVKVLKGNQQLKLAAENVFSVLFLIIFGLPALLLSGISLGRFFYLSRRKM